MSDFQPSRIALPRREFLHGAGALAATGVIAAASARVARSAHVAGDNEIKIAVIGCGGRGTGAALQALETRGPVTIVAMADAFEPNLQACLRACTEKVEQGKAENHPLLCDTKIDCPPERQFVGFDAYQKALAVDSDLVILATPPGFRPLHFKAAIDAGKHVFAEKPIAVDAPGVRMFMAANDEAKKKNLMVAIGLQRHHDPRYLETIQKIHDGAIGDVLATRVYWNSGGLWIRNREPGDTEMRYQMRNWYYFHWLCGDHFVEQHIHNLDVGNWIVGGPEGGAHPVECHAMGGREVRTGKDTGQIFDHFAAEYTYTDGRKMFSQARHIDGCWNEVGEAAHGTAGTADVGRFRIQGANGKWRSRLPGVDAWHQEHHDLFAALRRGEIYNEGDTGALATMTAVMGVMAAYSGKTITWDQALAGERASAPGLADYDFDKTPPVVPVPGKTDMMQAIAKA